MNDTTLIEWVQYIGHELRIWLAQARSYKRSQMWARGENQIVGERGSCRAWDSFVKRAWQAAHNLLPTLLHSTSGMYTDDSLTPPSYLRQVYDFFSMSSARNNQPGLKKIEAWWSVKLKEMAIRSLASNHVHRMRKLWVKLYIKLLK